MIKYIVIALVALGFIGRFIFNARTSSSIQGLAKRIKSGKLAVTDFASIFDIMLTSFDYTTPGPILDKLSFIKTGNSTIEGKKYNIFETKVTGNEAVVIASVTAKRETQYASDEVNTTLPVSLYIKNVDDKQLQYFCECPIDKEHEQYILAFITSIHFRLTS